MAFLIPIGYVVVAGLLGIGGTTAAIIVNKNKNELIKNLKDDDYV